MALLPLLVVTAIYAVQAVVFGWQRRWEDCLIIGGYTIANLGLISRMQG